MPVRINLLAEAQALEELRRRDPAKRAIMFGLCAVAALLSWSLMLYGKTLLRKSELTRLQTEHQSRTNEYNEVLAGMGRLKQANLRLAALQELTTNRHLNGNVLQALQQHTVDDVQLLRFKTEQLFLRTEGTKARTNSNGRVTPGKPPTITERIALILDCRDGGANPGDQVSRFKEALAEAPYFRRVLGQNGEIKLRNLSAPQLNTETGRPFVLFSLECRYPEVVR